MVGAETKLALMSTIQATFNAAGIASGSLHVGPNQRWVVTLLNTTTTSTTQTQCTVYRGVVGDRSIDFTRTGNGDTSSTELEFRQNESLAVLWENGTPGAVASLYVEGATYLRGQRGY